MDYAKIASQVIEHVGGKQNIKSVQHCATRLRLQLKDNDLRNEDAVSDIEGVKGVFLTQSQFQIIFGSGLVNLVCDEVQKQLGISVDTPADDEKEEKNDKGEYIRRERSYGSFSRSYDISEIDEGAINASFDNGVLTLKLPKLEKREPEQKQIEIQ